MPRRAGGRGLKRFQALLVAVPLAVSAAGCATQSNLVDLEREVASLKLRLGGASATYPTTAVATRAPSANGGAGANVGGGLADAPPATELLDLTIAVDQVRSEMAELRGQIDELLYGLNNLTRESDGRLTALESRAGIVAVSELTPPVPTGGLEPSRSNEPGSGPGAGALSVILPGVMIAPRDGDVTTGVSPDTAFGLAESDLKRGHFNLAAAGFANFIEQFPDSPQVPEASYLLGESFRGQGLPARAVKIWDAQSTAFPKSPVTPRALLALGETYRQMDDIPSAEVALKRLVSSFPESSEARGAKRMLAEIR